MNRATLIGRLGKDPEVRTTQNGTRVVSFSLATSERWRDKQTGERKEHTDWHNVVIWNEPLGKVAEQYLRKGSQCMIEGKIETRKWQDKDGNDRYTTEIVMQKFGGSLELLDSKRDDDGTTSNREYDGPGASSGAPAQAGGGLGSGRQVEQREAPYGGRSSALSDQLSDDVPF